jgi:adenosine kinase
MLQHARELAAHEIPFMFDPGQGLPMFSGEELLNFVKLATYVAVNDYEGKMLEERTGTSLEKIADGVKALIVTRGADGSSIFTEGQRIDVPCVKAKEVLDPTGCGDAYRAGLLYGITSGFDWLTCGQIASVMGSIKIASRGGQNHSPTRDEIVSVYQQAFGTTF